MHRGREVAACLMPPSLEAGWPESAARGAVGWWLAALQWPAVELAGPRCWSFSLGHSKAKLAQSLDKSRDLGEATRGPLLRQ